MSIFRKVAKDASKQAGSLLGNAVAENARQATSSAVKGKEWIFSGKWLKKSKM